MTHDSTVQALQGGQVAAATPHALATDAAIDVAISGGSVVDAALAAAAVLTVVYPHNTGLGGDAIALVRDTNGGLRCINASGPAAESTDVDDLRTRFGSTMPSSGPDTITVPGAVAGWSALHAHGGRLPWRSLFEPAITLAGSGFDVGPSLADAVRQYLSEGIRDPGMLATFVPGGRPLRSGDTLVQASLARTLASIAADGADTLYSGPLGVSLIEGLRRRGALLDTADLNDYAPETIQPLSMPVSGRTVWTAPPNSQGFTLLQILGAVDSLGPNAVDDTRGRAALLGWLFERSAEDRNRFLADPRHAPVDTERLLDSVLLRRYGRGDGLPHDVHPTPARENPPNSATGLPRGDTVAVVVADSHGNAVVLMQSLFHSFGSQILEPQTGIIAHNRGSLFSLHPSSPNVIAPGKRPAHTLTPVMVTGPEGLHQAIGTMGGSAQTQILAQVLLAVWSGRTAQEAVNEPRFVVDAPRAAGGRTGVVRVEADASPDVTRALHDAHWDVLRLPAHSEDAGHTQLVTSSAGLLSAAADPRSDGSGRVAPIPS